MNLTSTENLLNFVDDLFYTYLLTVLLILTGIYPTARNRPVQPRYFGTMINSLSGSRSDAQGGISFFQAFVVGLAVRVGIGNTAGVALTIVTGGPGTLFWMWVVALISMATSFVESTFARIFKERGRDFTLRGGPAHYIKNELGSTLWGKIFAAICIVSVGVTVVTVQMSSLAQAISTIVSSVSGWMVGAFLVLLTASVVLRGIRLVTCVAEWLIPIVALAHVLTAVVIIILNIGRFPEVLRSILEGAFDLNQVLLGIVGDILTVLSNGVCRGLFSSEAGLGIVPNAAGTATITHPVCQGLTQSFGVFIDTIPVCATTGLLILLAIKTYHPGNGSLVGAILTQQAVAEHLGAWTTWSMVVLTFILVLSTVLGCCSYVQVGVNFLGGGRRSEQIFGILLVTAISGGTVLTLPVVWALSDVALGPLGVLSLVIIIRLAPWVVGALRDFEPQCARGIIEPALVGHDNFLLPGDVVPDVWEPGDMVERD